MITRTQCTKHILIFALGLSVHSLALAGNPGMNSEASTSKATTGRHVSDEKRPQEWVTILPAGQPLKVHARRDKARYRNAKRN